jgi:hypothetical protein
MKVSMNINQHIEAESFPSFPASRRSRKASAASVARWHGLDDPTRQCPPTSVNVRQCPEQPVRRLVAQRPLPFPVLAPRNPHTLNRLGVPPPAIAFWLYGRNPATISYSFTLFR